ncbi:hypothetical protein O1611_g10498 [Lasiodiplodia mahajangana]|uniref:Uncharacterized protein n=1 Tax=Lasiodiplodia mahajangana TaxID=1108764 RepID=A0ACC2IXH9_9PEZI|nr:hypothetical protein O1611_g10498 [Lasiodiplodia mahajangana]
MPKYTLNWPQNKALKRNAHKLNQRLVKREFDLMKLSKKADCDKIDRSVTEISDKNVATGNHRCSSSRLEGPGNLDRGSTA